MLSLIIIGAQKCGTTSLHNYLGLHPEVSAARIKETNFFAGGENWERGVEWYAQHFDPVAPVHAEASPAYTDLPGSGGTAARLHSSLPGARLIYLVRDPPERIAAHWVHHRAVGIERRSFSEAVTARANPYVQRTRYAHQLQPFLDRFPRDQILVETQERLRDDRLATLRRVFRFAGVDDSFVSPQFDRMWERSEGKGTAYSMAWHMATRLRRRGFALPQSLRWPVQRLLRSPVAGRRIPWPTYDARTRAHIRDALKLEVDELRRLTGLALDHWSF